MASCFAHSVPSIYLAPILHFWLALCLLDQIGREASRHPFLVSSPDLKENLLRDPGDLVRAKWACNMSIMIGTLPQCL